MNNLPKCKAMANDLDEVCVEGSSRSASRFPGNH